MKKRPVSRQYMRPLLICLLAASLLLGGCSSSDSGTAAAHQTLPGGLFPGGNALPSETQTAPAATTTAATTTEPSTEASTTAQPAETVSEPVSIPAGSFAWQQNPLGVENLEGELEGVDYTPYLPVPEEVSRTHADLDYLYAHHGINHVGGGEKVLAITFSMGIEPGCTDRLLDVLKAKEVPATFLISLKEYLGSNLGNPEELIRRMVQEGHAIGSHGFTHVHSTMATNRRFLNELLLFQAQIDQTLRYHYPLTLFGAPYETLIERDIYLCDLMGIHFLGYSRLLADENGQAPVYMVLPQMKEALIPGSIIQMHVSEGNTEAIGDFIDYAKSQGYRFILPGK